ncbi:MAG: UDP-N-acetylglucosamine 2-epimerase [Oscillospiraceae bacterium]
MKKTIAVFTGTRAEYGLLRPVLQKMLASKIITPLLVVTGAHLHSEFGNTIGEIENDKMPIAAKIDIMRYGTGTLATAKTIALAIDLFSAWLYEKKPDAVLVLGDRYEIFAAATAAAALGIPLAHISGGDVTKGANDDFYRHAITKMAKVHFPSCEEYARRLIRMGEPPESVHNVGGLGDENIRSLPLLSKNALCESLGISDINEYCLVTFHPETGTNTDASEQMHALLGALYPLDMAIIFTKANADAGGDKINAMLDAFCEKKDNAYAFASLGVMRYLSAMKYCKAVIGNSSSGVVETPTMQVPCVNIGERQSGRIISGNIICCKAEKNEIACAIEKACSKEFGNIAKAVQSPYNGGDTSGKIVKIIEGIIESPSLREPKAFYDAGKADL